MIKNIISIGIQVFVVLIIFTGASLAGWGQANTFYSSGHMMGSGYMGWMMIFFWSLLLLMIILIIRWIFRLTETKHIPQTPLDILKNRLANGEVDIDEFKEKRQFL
jgi:putative membrane protein